LSYFDNRKKRKMKSVLILILLLSASTGDFLASACSERTGRWWIGRKKRLWCHWLRRGGRRIGADEVAHRCERKDLYKDCAVTCKTPYLLPNCIVPIPSWIGEIQIAQTDTGYIPKEQFL